MPTASQEIDTLISGLTDWRGRQMKHLRTIINEAAPNLDEDWKWDTPVWKSTKNVVALGVFKDHVKINFFKGASLTDPQTLFNAGLEAKQSRSIDIHEGDPINEEALKELIRSAAAA